MNSDDTRHSLNLPRERVVPVYAVSGHTAGTLASNLSAVAAERLKGVNESVLLVETESRASQWFLSSVASRTQGEFGSYPVPNLKLEILPYTGEDVLTTELLGNLRKQFCAIIVACGSSHYADNWVLAADRVIVSGGTSRELEETLRGVERLRGINDILLAPMGRLKLPESLPGSPGWPVVRLPSSRNAAFEQAEKSREFAALEDEEIGKSFEELLRELEDNTGEISAAPVPQKKPRQLREETDTKPENISESTPTESTGQDAKRSSGRLSEDEVVERMRQGANKFDDLHSGSVSEPERAPEPPKTSLEMLKSSVAAFSDKLRRRSRDNHDGEEVKVNSAEDLERRLKLSLRETAVGGISRVCVGSPKGGVGKSSIAYALAGSVGYYTNLRVCLVDADPNFGSMRLLVPRPVEHSVVSLANDANQLQGLSDIRSYVAQNERMRLDVVLGPEQASEMAKLHDLGEAYGRIDSVLSKFYDLVVYDLGLGFRDPAIRQVLSLSNELLFVTDSEVIPNAMLSDAIRYVKNLGVDLEKTTLVLNHRLPTRDESALAPQVRDAHTSLLRRVTEIPYDARMSQLLNQRAFHIEELSTPTRLGVLTTVAACLEGLRNNRGPVNKVVS